MHKESILFKNYAKKAKDAPWWTGAGGELQGSDFAEHNLKFSKV